MILFYGEGRLGNQIFQYQALTGLAQPHERLIAVGLEELQRIMELRGPWLWVLTRSRFIKRLVKFAVMPCLLRPLARSLRLFNYACERHFDVSSGGGLSGELSLRRGLFTALTLVEGGHFQSATFWPATFPSPTFHIEPKLKERALEYLNGVCGTRKKPAFIHVRRGDYVSHADYGLKDFALPASFYRAAIRELELQVPDVHLLFVTDEPRWVEDNFKDIEHKSLACFDAAMDFAIMTQCRLGILSNSTFSLAAALMIRNPEVLIGPKYWFGFRAGKWYPPGIRFSHPTLRYLPVEGLETAV